MRKLLCVAMISFLSLLLGCTGASGPTPPSDFLNSKPVIMFQGVVQDGPGNMSLKDFVNKGMQPGTWEKVDDAQWIYRVSKTDLMTKKQTEVSLLFTKADRPDLKDIVILQRLVIDKEDQPINQVYAFYYLISNAAIEAMKNEPSKNQTAKPQAVRQQTAGTVAPDVGNGAATNAATLTAVGKYTYREKGYSGNMEVTQISSVPVKWSAKIFTSTPNGDTCDVDVIGVNEISNDSEINASFTSKLEPNVPVTKLTVKFTKKGATIETREIGSGCGLNGNISGRWDKI